MEEVEEMSSVFWEFFKVLTKEGKVQAVKLRLTRVQVCFIKNLLLTLLIILNVHSNTASKIFGISPVMWTPSLFTMVAMVLRTSGSRAAGTFPW